MEIRTIKIADLVNDPANARKHSERNIESIMGSLRRFGQQKPIVIDKDGVVWAGNGTLEAAKRLGWETIQVTETTLADNHLMAYAIADNRTAELAKWDDAALAATLEGLQLCDESLLIAVGFNENELNHLLSDTELDNDKQSSEPVESKSQEIDCICPGCGFEFLEA